MISIGTRSLLVGVHQFVLHPLFVWVAWRDIYGRYPTFQQTICIILHDIGYAGCRNLDGPEGSRHPEVGASIAGRIFGPYAAALVRFHSRTTAELYSAQCSELCLPDKLSLFYYPAWLYTLLLRMGGEHNEYRQSSGLQYMPTFLLIHQFRVGAYRWAVATVEDKPVLAQIRAKLARHEMSSSSLLAAMQMASAFSSVRDASP